MYTEHRWDDLSHQDVVSNILRGDGTSRLSVFVTVEKTRVQVLKVNDDRSLNDRGVSVILILHGYGEVSFVWKTMEI